MPGSRVLILFLLTMDLDSADMIALQACIHYERRGVGLAPGKR